MSRLSFSADGKLTGVDYSSVEEYTTGSLLKSPQVSLVVSNFSTQYEKPYWSFYSDGKPLKPLMFSNGKTQEDVVKEVVELIRAGNKVIFIHGMCGTGKSAIGLNIARVLGRASLVVPVKTLQKQYEEDYMGKRYLLRNGRLLKVAIITGRSNHDSIFLPGVSCANNYLPDTIAFNEKNYGKLYDYYKKNPLIKNKLEHLDVKKIRRISVAPSNPYWSPIVPYEIELNLRDSEKKIYRGLNGKDFVFYHRKKGCSYYDQYDAYVNADVIIFNSMKYKIESFLQRKPYTDVEIIDESDDFLDSFSTQEELSVGKMINSLKQVFCESEEVQKILDRVTLLLELEEKQKNALGVQEKQIYPLKETRFYEIFKSVINNMADIYSEMSIDEMSYSNRIVEIAEAFREFIDETFVSFRKYESELYASFVTTNLSKKFNEMLKMNKAIVFMSGTIHSENVLKEVFGIDNFKIVEAESEQPGTIEIIKTGKEFDCKYSNFSNGEKSREDYLKALASAYEKAPKPVLVHVNAFDDLPTSVEIEKYNLLFPMTKENLQNLQSEDVQGRMISLFKSRLSEHLFTTKCSRGVDFPGDMCKSVIFTKYPNPNVQDSFWKILKQTHSHTYWEFYKDKARREFLQRIYRAVRSKDDHVYVLSPDLRVLEGVRALQNG